MTTSPGKPTFSVLDLLDLPPVEREVFLHVTRHGPADAAAIAAAMGRPVAVVSEALKALVQRGRLRLAANGVAEARLGRIASRTTLPTQMWPALLAPQRLYSEQEIATLTTAIPMLQFARAKMSEFADHGPSHVLRVKSYATQLSYVVGLTDTERRLLRAAALFHDIGNVVERERHHLISEEVVGQLTARGDLPFTAQEAELVGRLCRWHRREYEPERVDTLRGESVRTGLAASLLRVSDAMDIDSRRSDYDHQQRKTLEFFYPKEVPYWTSLEAIAGVRIVCRPEVTLQVFTNGPQPGNMQVQMLRKDLAATPLGWSVEEVEVGAAPPPMSGGRALLVFPYDAHSIVMAALSRQNLLRAGAEVEVLCYPDTNGGTAWLWREALREPEGDGWTQLIVIGDRPEAGLGLHRLTATRRWQSKGTTVSVLNRHEANWAELPALLAAGAQAVLGGDWAYFWGPQPALREISWERVAALCARDPTLAAIGIAPREQAVMRGLLNSTFQTLTLNPPNNTAGWCAAAEAILDRIAANDTEHFAQQAPAFTANYAAPGAPGRLAGRAIVFDRPPGAVPQSFYWILEASIEREGRASQAGVRYNVPYAVASWPVGDQVELLAINHWRDEGAIPIRLLYPSDLGPPPGGTENVVHVRLPADRAQLVLDGLLAAINRDD